MTSSIEYYETEVARQTARLDKMSKPSEFQENGSDEDAGGGEEGLEQTVPLSIEDLKKEEEEIKDLERKKQSLEDRVSGMEKDLGGLMR